MDDLCTLLTCNYLPVVHLIVEVFLERFDLILQHSINKNHHKILEFYRSLIIDVIGNLICKSAKVLKESRSEQSNFAVEKCFDVNEQDHFYKLKNQQIQFCSLSSGQSKLKSPLQAFEKSADEDQLKLEESKQLLLNWLCSRDAEIKELSRSAYCYWLDQWCSQRNNCKGDGFRFWESLRKDPTFHNPHAENLVPTQNVEMIVRRVMRESSYYTNFSSRVNRILISLLREGKNAEKVKVLKVLNEILSIDPELPYPIFLQKIEHSLLLDPENANMRSAAIEIFSKIALQKFQENEKSQDFQKYFGILCGRSFDTSIRVRQAIIAFLKQIAFSSRFCLNKPPEEQMEKLIGFQIQTVQETCSMSFGEIEGYNSMEKTFDVRYGSDDCSKSIDASEIVYHLIPGSNETMDLLVYHSNLLVQCCDKVSEILQRQEDDCIRESCISFFMDLWFVNVSDRPIQWCLEEILYLMCYEGDQREDNNSTCLETILPNLLKNEKLQGIGRIYVELMFSRIKNIQKNSLHTDGEEKPNTFCQSNSRMVMSCIKMMIPWAKVFTPCFEVHLMDLVHLFGFADNEREKTSVIINLLDLVIVLSSNLHYLPAEFEAFILQSYSCGSLKLSDPKRWKNVDDLKKAVKCLCCVIKCNKTQGSIDFLLKSIKQYLAFLQRYISNPKQEENSWVARALILCGSIVRYSSICKFETVSVESLRQARDELYCICISRFSNHSDESIKRCALNCIGSVCLNDPSKLLQNACMKLMTKNLSIESKPAYQIQVLKNFIDLFEAEEHELANSLNKYGLLQYPSEAPHLIRISDTSTTVMHKFHSMILDLSLSSQFGVRFEAVKLIGVILRRGLTASYICLPFLLAQQAKSDKASSLSLKLLNSIHEKDSAHFTAHMFWDGICKSFQLCESIEDISSDAFCSAFKIVTSSGKDNSCKFVRQLLNVLISKFDVSSESIEDNLVSAAKSHSFKLFLAEIIAKIPYLTLDGPLYLLSLTHQSITSLSGQCLSIMKSVPAYHSENHDDVLRAKFECASAALLAELHIYVQSMYGIKHERLRKFLESACIDKSPIKAELKSDKSFKSHMLFQEKKDSYSQDIERLDELLRLIFCHDQQRGTEKSPDDENDGCKARPQEVMETSVLKREVGSKKQQQDNVYEKGMRVELLFTDGVWYPGTVTKASEQKVFVKFDDGDRYKVMLPCEEFRRITAD
eukprot:767867-Hanusia_phi.AAC.2